jgi:hypothetical protein
MSFDDCVTHHLLTVFTIDAADRQKFYISNHLKKPQRVTVRAFFTRVEQLNSYIELLPGLYNSPKAGPAMKPVEPFDEAELACQLLRMCPESWQDHSTSRKKLFLKRPGSSSLFLRTLRS